MLSLSAQREAFNRWRGVLSSDSDRHSSELHECMEIMQNHGIYFSVQRLNGKLHCFGHDFNNPAADFSFYNVNSSQNFLSTFQKFIVEYDSLAKADDYADYMYDTEGTCVDDICKVDGIPLELYTQNLVRDCHKSFGLYASCCFELYDRFYDGPFSLSMSDVMKDKLSRKDYLHDSDRKDIFMVLDTLRLLDVSSLMQYNRDTHKYDLYLHKKDCFDLKVENVYDGRSVIDGMYNALQTHDFKDDLAKKLEFYRDMVVTQEDGQSMMNGRPFEDVCSEMAKKASDSSVAYSSALSSLINVFSKEYGYTPFSISNLVKSIPEMKVNSGKAVEGCHGTPHFVVSQMYSNDLPKAFEPEICSKGTLEVFHSAKDALFDDINNRGMFPMDAIHHVQDIVAASADKCAVNNGLDTGGVYAYLSTFYNGPVSFTFVPTAVKGMFIGVRDVVRRTHDVSYNMFLIDADELTKFHNRSCSIGTPAVVSTDEYSLVPTEISVLKNGVADGKTQLLDISEHVLPSMKQVVSGIAFKEWDGKTPFNLGTCVKEDVDYNLGYSNLDFPDREDYHAKALLFPNVLEDEYSKVRSYYDVMQKELASESLSSKFDNGFDSQGHSFTISFTDEDGFLRESYYEPTAVKGVYLSEESKYIKETHELVDFRNGFDFIDAYKFLDFLKKSDVNSVDYTLVPTEYSLVPANETHPFVVAKETKSFALENKVELDMSDLEKKKSVDHSHSR